MKLSLKRHELEDFVEDRLAAIAGTLVGEGNDDLKAAYDYHPTFFGGDFPALGVSVMSTRGKSGIQDKPDRPGEILVEVHVYEPSIPVRGVQSLDQDRTSRAKKLTRKIRGEFLARVFEDHEIAPFVEVMESRGGDRDEIGQSRTDETERDILWIDRSDLVIRPQ